MRGALIGSRFLAGRFVALIVTLLVGSLAIYGAMYIAPGSPLAFVAGGHALSSIQIAALTAEYHLNEPFLVQYWNWLWAIMHGHLGESIIFRRPVSSLIWARLGTSALLVGYAAVLIGVIGLSLGVVGPLLGGKVDTAVVVLTSVGVAVPAFIMALVLIFLFGVKLGWFPVFGVGSGLIDMLWHLTLPAVTLASSSACYVARVSRAALVGEFGREHVETARSRGIPERLVVWRHVIRNGMLPIVTVGAVTVATLIAADVIVEDVFALPGVGSLLVQSVSARDYPVVQAISVILVVVFVVTSTLVDVLYWVLDPRVSHSRRA
jgi:peptide/nickel transport system permease protein